jgi:hypothetical protein
VWDSLWGKPRCNEFFFRRGLAGGQRLRQEVFYLAYYLHWSWSEVMELTVGERHVYVRMLAERIEEENRAVEALNERLRR